MQHKPKRVRIVVIVIFRDGCAGDFRVIGRESGDFDVLLGGYTFVVINVDVNPRSKLWCRVAVPSSTTTEVLVLTDVLYSRNADCFSCGVVEPQSLTKFEGIEGDDALFQNVMFVFEREMKTIGLTKQIFSMKGSNVSSVLESC